MATRNGAGRIERLDRSGMLAAVSAFPEDWEESVALGRKRAREIPAEAKHLLMAGMGGSGIQGDFVAAVARPSGKIPVTVLKGYDLPAFADRSCLLIAVSYSGNTAETLSVARAAKERRLPIVAVTSGGRLAERCKENGDPVLSVRSDRVPRAAFPAMSGAVMGFLSESELVPVELPKGDGLRSVARPLAPSVGTASNPAKRWGGALANSRPVIYGAGALSVAALRFKCQLNENAKMFAQLEEIPESNHNDLVPWFEAPKDPKRRLVAFRAGNDPPELRSRFEFLERAAKRSGGPVLRYTPPSSDLVESVLEAILFGDHVSIYAALSRGVDPTPVPPIPKLKAFLARQAP